MFLFDFFVCLTALEEQTVRALPSCWLLCERWQHEFDWRLVAVFSNKIKSSSLRHSHCAKSSVYYRAQTRQVHTINSWICKRQKEKANKPDPYKFCCWSPSQSVCLPTLPNNLRAPFADARLSCLGKCIVQHWRFVTVYCTGNSLKDLFHCSLFKECDFIWWAAKYSLFNLILNNDEWHFSLELSSSFGYKRGSA